ncbi:uncharacterized protein I303_105591 [Kwoniella dejecticola CBS 10117]|uniref:Uncharacterized protein n=1 Tax=Kwoniella dejecticola CBS 10117 TaxID=1296121 RepID=A0A1A6A253_9TREE|nr:uncharacterized protein I303_04966 [Kwoniella dejecticola CBS 10117]OBR84109.1 hypothetical protein I303_04966 [Kwoniella dejecticola CBS 10117]
MVKKANTRYSGRTEPIAFTPISTPTQTEDNKVEGRTNPKASSLGQKGATKFYLKGDTSSSSTSVSTSTSTPSPTQSPKHSTLTDSTSTSTSTSISPPETPSPHKPKPDPKIKKYHKHVRSLGFPGPPRDSPRPRVSSHDERFPILDRTEPRNYSLVITNEPFQKPTPVKADFELDTEAFPPLGGGPKTNIAGNSDPMMSGQKSYAGMAATQPQPSTDDSQPIRINTAPIGQEPRRPMTMVALFDHRNKEHHNKADTLAAPNRMNQGNKQNLKLSLPYANEDMIAQDGYEAQEEDDSVIGYDLGDGEGDGDGYEYDPSDKMWKVYADISGGPAADYDEDDDDEVEGGGGHGMYSSHRDEGPQGPGTGRGRGGKKTKRGKGKSGKAYERAEEGEQGKGEGGNDVDEDDDEM